MVHFIALYQLKPGTSDEVIESMIRDSRSNFSYQLILKIWRSWRCFKMTQST